MGTEVILFFYFTTYCDFFMVCAKYGAGSCAPANRHIFQVKEKV